MYSEAESISREFYTAIAEAAVVENPLGFEEYISYATRLASLETSKFSDGLILIMAGKSLIQAELWTRPWSAACECDDERQAFQEWLDQLTTEGIALLNKGMEIVAKDSDTPIDPLEYVPDELTNPTLN